MRSIPQLLCIGAFCLAATTACIPIALLGAGAVTGSALSRDSRSLQTISDDTDMQFQVNQAFRKDPAINKDANISPLVFNHIVLLVGEAPSETVRATAEQLAQKVPKVRRVYNQIQITTNVGAIQLANDATISTNIKARMAMTSNLNSNNFTYVVENKVVYLMGLATTEQTRIATDVIRNSSGVKKLVTLVEITNDTTAATTSAPETATTTPSVNVSSDPTATPAVTTPTQQPAPAAADVSFQPIKES